MTYMASSPQPTGLLEIPGDDGLHPYMPAGPTDVRGMCPTLNTMANHGEHSTQACVS